MGPHPACSVWALSSWETGRKRGWEKRARENGRSWGGHVMWGCGDVGVLPSEKGGCRDRLQNGAGG